MNTQLNVSVRTVGVNLSSRIPFHSKDLSLFVKILRKEFAK
jgi:hypothetical protein